MLFLDASPVLSGPDRTPFTEAARRFPAREPHTATAGFVNSSAFLAHRAEFLLTGAEGGEAAAIVLVPGAEVPAGTRKLVAVLLFVEAAARALFSAPPLALLVARALLARAEAFFQHASAGVTLPPAQHAVRAGLAMAVGLLVEAEAMASEESGSLGFAAFPQRAEPVLATTLAAAFVEEADGV